MESLELKAKVCTHCGEANPICGFYKHKTNKDRLYSKCKTCCKKIAADNAIDTKEYKREHYKKNRESITASQKEYRDNNAEKMSIMAKNSYEKHKTARLLASKAYAIANKEKVKEYKKKYKQNNKEKTNASQRILRFKNKDANKLMLALLAINDLDKYAAIKQRRSEISKSYSEKNKVKITAYRVANAEKIKIGIKKRMEVDTVFYLKIRTAKLIGYSIWKKGYSKKSRTNDILGCDYETFIAHLESQFTDGMNWDRRGCVIVSKTLIFSNIC